MADVGLGTTVAFATTGFDAKVVSVDAGGFERPVIDDTHLGTTGGNRTNFPGKLVTPGSFTVEMQWDPDKTPPIDQPAEVITFTFPVPDGLTNGATCSGTGYINTFNFQVGAPDDLMGGSYTITWDGKTGPTWADAS